MRIVLFCLVFFLLAPAVVLAQDDVEPTTTEYLALLFNIGIVGAVVQLVKWKLIPWMKTSAPFLIPILGMVIGVISAWLLAQTGIDISPIGDVLGAGIMSGALASTGFVVLKEISNKRS